MSNILFYDSTGIVASMVTNYLQSVNTPDYDYLPNVIVNPDISGVSGLAQKYWKVDNGSVIEMSDSDKTSVDNYLNAKTFRNRNYLVSTYDASNRLTKTIYYEIDNGDGTYSGKAEETDYTYDGSVYTLLSKVVKTYYFDGTVYSTDTYEYYKNDQNEIIEKKV